jgi:hypothetical protein
MAIKDITSAIKPGSATDIESMHYLEAETGELGGIVADPHGFLTKNKLKVTAQSQVHTTVVRRPQAGATARSRVVIIIAIHFRNCDWLVGIIVA